MHTHQQKPAPPPLLPIVHMGTPEGSLHSLDAPYPPLPLSDSLTEI
jgi:hypothetical protein